VALTVPEAPSPRGADANVLEAFAKDSGPAAEAVSALLQDPSKERADALLKDLPALLPEDPALAAIIAEEMAKQFSAGMAQSPSAPIANSITNPCPKCHRQMTKDNICTHCSKLASNKMAVNNLVDELSKKSPDGKHPGWSHKEESLGDVDDKTAAAIRKAVPEMDVAGQEMIVDTTQLKHALNGHGEGREKHPNQIPVTEDDLRRLPDVLMDYDDIIPGKGTKDGKANNAVIFRKRFDDGTINCVEIDQYSEKRKGRILRFKTMWKEKAV